jgi:cell division protease FtsH
LTPPDAAAREKILRLHAKDKKFADDVDFHELAKDTIGYSGAGLETLLNEAALLALTRKTPSITRKQIEEASIQMALKGHIKNSIGDRSREEHEIVSYHEAGHAAATLALTDNIVRRVTVLPTTAGTGGITMSVPPADRNLPTVGNLESRVKMLYAGRAAEYLLAGKVETGVSLGAAQDIREATHVIQNLVTLSQKNGLLDYGDFGLAGQNKMMDLCEHLSQRLWEETVAFAEEHWDAIDRIAKGLLEKDTLTAEEVKVLYRGESTSAALPTTEETSC